MHPQKPENITSSSNQSSTLTFNEGIYISKNKLYRAKKNKIEVNLIELFSMNRIELIEFIDGKVGCLIKNI